MDINNNQALFSLIGTYYGGDGRSTFGLPDLRGRVPVHQGRGPGLSEIQVGQRGGSESITPRSVQVTSASSGGVNVASGLSTK